MADFARAGSLLAAPSGSGALEVELWIPQDLPQVAVGIAEVAGVDTPGTVVGPVGQRRTGRPSAWASSASTSASLGTA
jgi:hypothetical protein